MHIAQKALTNMPVVFYSSNFQTFSLQGTCCGIEKTLRNVLRCLQGLLARPVGLQCHSVGMHPTYC